MAVADCGRPVCLPLPTAAIRQLLPDGLQTWRRQRCQGGSLERRAQDRASLCFISPARMMSVRIFRMIKNAICCPQLKPARCGALCEGPVSPARSVSPNRLQPASSRRGRQTDKFPCKPMSPHSMCRPSALIRLARMLVQGPTLS